MDNFTWNDPKITIGGVPTIQQTFSWALTPGANPYMTSIIIPIGTLNNQLKAVENPTEVYVEVYGSTEGKPIKQEFTISDVYLIQPRENNKINATWQLADKRFAWRGQKLFFSYNKTREKNDIIRAFSGLPATDPSVIRQITDRYKTGKYLPWSVKEDGITPYSMLEIAAMELDKIGITIDPSNLGTEENISYIVENVEMLGADIYQGLNDILSRSRLGMTVALDGTIEIFSVDFFDNSPEDLINYLQNLQPTQPNTLYRQNLSRTRPNGIYVHFEKKIETKLVAADSKFVEVPGKSPIELTPNPPSYTRENIDDRLAIGCENVIPVPYPYNDSEKKLWNIGEYVPMWKYLSDIGLSEALVCEYYFSDQLAIYFAQKTTGSLDLNRLQLAFHIANTIKYHFRQTYQIDPYYMDRIKSWETRRVGIQDNYSRFSPPSPLWADYCVAPNARIPLVAKKLAIWSPAKYYNWYVNQNDPYREKLTPGSISTVNSALGIFRVNYPNDQTRNIKQIIPSAIETGTVPGVSLTEPIYNQVTDMRLSAYHTLETLVSIVWHTDKDDNFDSRGKEFDPFVGGVQNNLVSNKYDSIFLDYSPLNGAGPEIEYLSGLDYSRYSFPTTKGESQIPNTEPGNIGNLEDMAQAEGAKIINQYKDRISGTATYAGAITGQLKVIGTILSVVYSFTPGRGLETKVTLAEHTPTPRLLQSLSQNTINFLQKQVTRAGDQNNIGVTS